MNGNTGISVHSETGVLEAVILHNPGPEVENMTPLNAQRALYSDILNLSVTKKEYSQLNCILERFSQTFFVEKLLEEVLHSESVKSKLVRNICRKECTNPISASLMNLEPSELSRKLIEGVPLRRDTLTNYLSKDNYALQPLHNFFFTRDSAVCIYDRVLISSMASRVRERESLIMQTIFENHPEFSVGIMSAPAGDAFDPHIKMEGGDILVAREDIILMGIGARTSSHGVDFLLSKLKEKKEKQHVIVQELPLEPESFIHLDMAFTLLDTNTCMVYEPLILKPNRYETVHITLDNGKVTSIRGVKNIPDILDDLGMPLEIAYCGGRKDPVIQEREQWHSGANFFALGPGKVIGYSRNVYTLEDLNRLGFEIIRANEILSGKTDPGNYQRYVISMDGSELARGGGGARCMTMPLRRKNLQDNQ